MSKVLEVEFGAITADNVEQVRDCLVGSKNREMMTIGGLRVYYISFGIIGLSLTLVLDIGFLILGRDFFLYISALR